MQNLTFCGQSILKVIQLLNTVCIVQYTGCSVPVIWSSLYAVVGLRQRRTVRISREFSTIFEPAHVVLVLVAFSSNKGPGKPV